jgi:hypothetical protein
MRIMLGLGRERKNWDQNEKGEDEGEEERQDLPDDGPEDEAGGTLFLSEMDREYLASLVELEFKDDALELLDKAYSKMKREPDTLLTGAEERRFEELLEDGTMDEAAELVEVAYHRAKKQDEQFLSPLDKEYIDTLQELGERERAKSVLDEKRESFEERKADLEGHLLTPIDREYMEKLKRAGKRDMARDILDDIYRGKRSDEERLGDLVSES